MRKLAGELCRGQQRSRAGWPRPTRRLLRTTRAPLAFTAPDQRFGLLKRAWPAAGTGRSRLVQCAVRQGVCRIL